MQHFADDNRFPVGAQRMASVPIGRETLITPDGGRWLAFWRELIEFRGLLSFMILKDIKVQFAQTVLGFGWLILRPLLNVAVLTLVFGKIARIPADGAPYALFAMAGILPWSYFSGVTSKSALSLVSNSALVTKVYFPRVYLPLSLAAGGLVDFAVTLVLFVLLSVFYYGILPGAQVLWLGVPFLLLLLTTVGASLWLAALAVDFRDVRHATQYLLQFLIFTAPVIWPISLLTQRFGSGGEAFLDWYAFYPLVGIVEGCRSALLGQPMPWELLAKGAVAALLLAGTGLAYFRRRERLLADRV